MFKKASNIYCILAVFLILFSSNPCASAAAPGSPTGLTAIAGNSESSLPGALFQGLRVISFTAGRQAADLTVLCPKQRERVMQTTGSATVRRITMS